MAHKSDERGKAVAKVAIVILADTDTGADRARVANALTTAYEFKEAEEEVTLVFTGAGTRWVGQLADPDHRLNRAFRLVKDEVAGACKACGVPLLAEYRGHQSLRRLISEGYQIVTF
jgi:hypothetical protein